tara:strand:+ start:1014 stop:3806 length:2793 start_codon:yes stop_codon:yes gene_type:complete
MPPKGQSEYLRFLQTHVASDAKSATHTRIPNEQKGIYAGKYHIPPSELEQFYKLYYNQVFLLNTEEYLTEKQNSDGNSPILVDFDFHYPKDVTERQYSYEEHIEPIIDLYHEKLCELIDIGQHKKWDVFIFEKPNINRKHKHSEEYVKDGIHMVIGIQLDHKLQQMLRERVLKDIEGFICDITLVNKYEEVLDECISTGKTNWQLYGSRKPQNEAYKLTYHLRFEIDGADGEMMKELIEIPRPNIPMSLFKKCCAQYNDHPKFEMREEVAEEYKKFEEVLQRKKAKKTVRKSKLRVKSVVNSYTDFKNEEELDAAIQEFVYNKDMRPEDFYLRELHEMAIALSKKYYDPYDKWRSVGVALHEASDILFLTWMKFSSKSNKFDYEDVATYYQDNWQNFDPNGGITRRSIYWMLKEDNVVEYKRIKRQSLTNQVSMIAYGDGVRTRNTDHDLAELLHMAYKDDYICSGIKNDTWFEYEKNSWIETEKGIGLRTKLSTEITQLLLSHLSSNLHQTVSGTSESDGKKEPQDAACARIMEVLERFMNTNKKDAIMKEARELFYDKNFHNNLDENQYLMGCANGVIDFKNKEFREGRAEDYISISTKNTYIPLDKIKANPKQAKYIGEIEDFIKQLFPVEELRKYMWEHLASTLLGVNKNQTFNIYTGSGSNGKSALVDLMRLVLGDYQGTAPVTIITCGRNKSGGTNTELVQLKGMRYAVMQEPSKGDRINDGMLKEITGGDIISARGLYQSNMTNYIPQFKLVVCTNNLFDIKSNDDGTWRRIRVVEFMSKFTDNPVDNDPDKPYQFKKNKSLNENFKKWAPVLLSMLVEIAYKTEGNVTDYDIVMQASNQYRDDQDYLTEFVKENIVVSDGDRIKKGELCEQYKQWFEQQFGKRASNTKELYAFMDKRFGKFRHKRGWQNVKILYEDDSEDSD